MKFISTRGGGGKVSAQEAVVKGIAEDGGLFVPCEFPVVSVKEIESMADMDFHERASLILSKFFTDFSQETVLKMCESAYEKFNGEPVPTVKIDDETYVMELFHGPTLAFKDVALCILPYMLTESKRSLNESGKTLILVATSGDTGKASLEGFKNVEGTEIIVVYPSDGVSEMQKLQMQTAGGSNVHVIAIEGNFDDAQTAVKQIFNDKGTVKEFGKMGYQLSSANSINFGRLAPQISYYFSSYADLVASEEIHMGDKINFVVPTGNFGNVLAGYYAKKMGLPVNKFIVASNENNVLTEFFNTGHYDANRKFFKTMSPSMDILISSNLERLLFELLGREAELVKSFMNDLLVYGEYQIERELLRQGAEEFEAYCAGEDETAEAIDNFFDMFGYVLDPHTGVAVASYYNYVADTDDNTKTVIVATASPFKFPEDVLKCLTGKSESDAERAIKKFASYTGEDIPEEISGLFTLPKLHNIVIPKTLIKETIFDLLKRKA
ncbi:MAG: threonine synthase [Firmicutes bacterium]|nr:threonine synthase [Bacillota bacterium]